MVGRLPSNIIKLTVVTVFNEKQFYVELCAGEGMMVEEIIIYAGPGGSGKTSLITCIRRAIRPHYVIDIGQLTGARNRYKNLSTSKPSRFLIYNIKLLKGFATCSLLSFCDYFPSSQFNRI